MGEAILTAQDIEKFGAHFTQIELSERANLSIKTLKKIRDLSAPVDEASVRSFFRAFDLELETADYGRAEKSPQQSESQASNSDPSLAPKIDWGEKPDTAIFFGRTEEVATLGQWVMEERCRVVTLLGMGGIGKTSLAAKLADQIYEQFDYVIWRSLREAPPLDEILVRLIQFLSDQQETEINLPSRLGERIIRLLHYLREYRCLLVLDNLESILQAESTGQFRNGHEGYGELIHRIGEAEHQSCLLLTSRECPRELALMAGNRLLVRLWSVTGIDTDAGREILKTKGLELEDADTQGQELIRRYSGNPQALHLVATAIQREFLGDVNDFLEEEGAAVEDVHSLLDQHLTRLAPLERSILFWLAINREPVGLDELMEDLLPSVTKREVRSALRGLSDRYLIETVGKQFTLQNVIMEFATDRFIEQIVRELETQKFDLFHTHALIKATAKDYVRETQIRLILTSLITKFDNLKIQVNSALLSIKKNSCWRKGYAAGNLLNILCQTQPEVSQFNFSQLTLRQAYLKGIRLNALDLSNTNFCKPALTYPFGQVYSVAFSPNGKWLATTSSDATIRLWNIEEQCCVYTLISNISGFNFVAFSPDGKQLVTRSHDTSVRLWDIEQQQYVRTFTGHEAWVISVAFSPDGKQFATGSQDTTVRLWDVAQQRCIHIFIGHSKMVRSVAFSPDGKYLATGSNDTTVRLWDVAQQRCIHIFIGHSKMVRSVAFSPDGKHLATGSNDTTVRLWDVAQQRCIHIFIGHSKMVRSVAFSPDGKYLATGSGDTTIRLWDTGQQQCIHTFTGHTAWVRSVAFSPNGKWLATGSRDTTIRLWDLEQQQCIHTFTGHAAWIISIAFSPDGKWLATGSRDAIVQLWDTRQRQCIHTSNSHTAWVSTVAFSPDGKWLATGSGDTTVQLWDIEQWKCIYTFKDNNDWIISVAFSPNGKWLAVGTADATLQLWDIEQIRCIYTFDGHSAEVISTVFSPNGEWLATGSGDGTVRLWDINRRQCAHTFTGHNDWVNAVAFSPNGKFLAAGGGNGIILWDVQQRQCAYAFNDQNDWVNAVAFSPDGKWLATGSEDATVRLWDMKQRQCVHTFLGHTAAINSIAFSPDGKWLATGSGDSSVRLWDFETRACSNILPLPGLYEGTNIYEAQGLTNAQRSMMLALGAIDCSSNEHYES
ncbi:eIF2A-related protein [Sphaerothrix gracilis]|uniref:WD40 domain-containing protein n=1 Tax=Sphaerothrix gracilis TaxID=3151835 RepID=UPI0031FE13D3